MIKFLQNFEEKSLPKKIAVNAAVILVLAILDIITGSDIAFSIFYLIPVALITWTAGKNPGIIFSITAAVLWAVADKAGGRIYQSPIILFWNSTVRLAFFLIVTFILDAFKKQKNIEEDYTHFLIHDLRSPLSNIIMSLNILKEESFEEKEKARDEIIDLTVASGKRMISFINSLLDLSRLENNKMPIHTKEINLSEISGTAVDEVKSLAKEKNIDIKTLFNVQEIISDENLLLRIITNLLANAIKVNPSNSEIVLEESDMGNGAVRFDIKDMGPGIPEGMEKKIFDLYTQLEARKAGKLGSGIGLAFSKTAVEALGGKIWIENRKNGGAKVSFILPQNYA